MYGDALLLEMVTDQDLSFALEATGVPPSRLPVILSTVREDPSIQDALLDDERVFAALTADPQVFMRVSPYLLFSVLLHRARRELAHRTYTAEWLGPRRRVPVFDAHQVAEALADEERVRYLAELLSSFTRVHSVPRGGQGRLRAQRRFHELNLRDLRRLRAQVTGQDRFALDRRLGDVALLLAGVFPDSAQAVTDMDAWEQEAARGYARAAEDPLAERLGLDRILERLAGDPRTTRKALNFVVDRFLQPLRASWFRLGA